MADPQHSPRATLLSASGASAVKLYPACVDDVEGIYSLIDEASRTTTVLPRTRDSICEHLRDFIVARHENRIVGCGALTLFTRTLAEIKSLVISPAMRGGGLGTQIIRGLIEEARRLGVRRVFALTDNPGYFIRLGFREADKVTLPHKVWNECLRCPKFLNCTETAVDIVLTATGAGEPRADIAAAPHPAMPEE